MATGAWQEVHGVTTNWFTGAVAAESVLSLARAAGLSTATGDGGFWSHAFGTVTHAVRDYPKEPAGAAPEAIIAYQRKLCDALAGFVTSSRAAFTVVDLTGVDTAAHEYGPLSPAGRDAARELDACARRITGLLDLEREVVIITSDHGHIQSGGHGGGEDVVLNVPLIIAGGPARSGHKPLDAQQTDIAPTICGLLGLPFPSTNQGRFLSEAFGLPEAVTQGIEQRLDRQIAEFQDRQARVLGGTRESAPQTARAGRTFHSTVALLLLLLLIAWILLRVCATRAERRALGWGVAAFYLVYFGLFSLGGLGYSFSTVNREEYLGRFFQKNMIFAGVALLAAAALARWLHRGDRWKLPAALSALVSLSLLAQVAIIYWSTGLFMTRWMPDLRWGFKAYLDLLAVFALGFAMWLSPLAMLWNRR
jgi:hypothetical protein